MKIMILTTIKAPYRIDLFEELGKYCDLTVCFEQKEDTERNENWYRENATSFKSIELEGWEKNLRNIKFQIKNILLKEKFDLVILYEYSTPTAIYLATVCKFKKIKYVINCDGAFIKKNYIKNKLKKYAIGNSNGLLASGKYAEKYFIQYKGEKEKIFYHKFTSLKESQILKNIQNKREIRKKLKLEEKKTVITVGSFIERKGIDIVLKAWEGIEDFNLVIVGEGPDYQKYKDIIESKKLKNIYMKKFMNYKELEEYYRASDLFVLQTREDVWGLVINEAMANGLPIITTNKCIAGLELIEDNINGFIIDVENYRVLKEKIRYILNNNEIRNKMGRNNLEKISSYTIENLAQNQYEAFKKILK